MNQTKKKEEQLFQAIAYYRLSRENRGQKNESDSIANQRKLILDYVNAHPNITLVKEACDDGYTGTNYDRPGFQSIMKNLEDGTANMVIVKDLSRLGREYIETGKMIEMQFPKMKVRFVAINDDVDSEHRTQGDDLMIPFKNLMNENYCRELSNKLRKQFKMQREQGEFISNFTVYGYKRNPQDKHKIVIDQDAAEVVRSIFNLAMEGYNPNRIAKQLNLFGIPAPFAYKQKETKYASGFKGAGECIWNPVSVRRILTNQVYLGVLIQGKTATPSFKIKKAKSVKESLWSVVYDNHEPIIEDVIFQTVQKMLSRDIRITAEKQDILPLSGMVYCGDCGHAMNRRSVTRGEKKYYYYWCGTYKRGEGCSSHNISQNALEEVILHSLERHILTVCQLDELGKQLKESDVRTIQLKQIDKILIDKEKEQEKYKNILLKLYEAYVDTLIDQDEYRMMKENYKLRLQELEESLKAYHVKKKELEQNKQQEESWLQYIIQFKHLHKLSHEAVITLIDKIEIFEDKRIEVRFQFKDEFQEYQKNMELLEKEVKEYGKEK